MRCVLEFPDSLRKDPAFCLRGDDLRGLGVQLWNTFNRRTRMCRTVNEIMQQVTWLVGQFKPNIFHPRWLASTQSAWLEEFSRVEDVKRCKHNPLFPRASHHSRAYCAPKHRFAMNRHGVCSFLTMDCC